MERKGRGGTAQRFRLALAVRPAYRRTGGSARVGRQVHVLGDRLPDTRHLVLQVAVLRDHEDPVVVPGVR